jgi:mono/diheme cytochrome c family protein
VQSAIWRQLLAVQVIIVANTGAGAQDPGAGRTEYLHYCAECHGTDGKGGGRLSSNLEIKPADLTVLAKRNGVFSPYAIAKKIDGRNASHRSLEMPIWGCRQGPPPTVNRKVNQARPIDSLLDLPCDPEEVIQRRIWDVVGYLAQIQEK